MHGRVRTARRTPRGEARRSALLEAAREVFLEQGYEGASIEEIVRRVGGSKASLYAYFGSKQGLFWEVACDADRRVRQPALAVPTQANPDLEQTLPQPWACASCAASSIRPAAACSAP